MFEPVGARYDGPEIEKRILDFWRRENVFGRLMTEGAARPQFVFYEGPPTANGRPGLHHAWARLFKDIYPRFQTMRGHLVRRQGGWDCHGLPVEVEVEKELGFSGKQQIEAFGIAEFNARCRESVLRHVDEFTVMTERMGYWVDFDDAYWTMNPEYIQSVWWSLKQIFDALQRNNALAGGGYIEHRREQLLIRGEALATRVSDLARIVVAHGSAGVPIYIADVAEVREASALRIGAATAMGDGETVIGMVQMLAGENAQRVVTQVKERVLEIQQTLPPGVVIKPYYDRTLFVSKVIRTVRNNLLEGGLLVIAVLFLFLGNLRAGLIVASAIPLSMLIAFTGMMQAGLSGNLMSLGAIDFGLLVDGSVVMVDNILRRLSASKNRQPEERLAQVLAAGREVLRPMTFAVGIIILVYLPILTLTGIEGKMFRPMAATVIMALAGSLLLAVTVTPLLSFWFAGTGGGHEETRLIRIMRGLYAPCLRWALARPMWPVAIAVGLFLLSLGLGARLGIEFVPRLDEGDLAVQVWRLPSVSLSESVATALDIERVLRRFPEVTQVVTRTGSPEVATDVMGVEMSDVFVILTPQREWRTADTREALIAQFKQAIMEQVPGVGLSFTQPIEMRLNEIGAGIRSDLGVKLFGNEFDTLKAKAREVEWTRWRASWRSACPLN